MTQRKTTRRAQAATSYHVAQEANVSQSAVSRAFKPGGSVSKATREKIYAAANKLGYRPNAIARSLISKKSGMVGIVMADITNPFYPAVLEIFLKKLQEAGQKSIVLMAARDHPVDELLPQLLEYQVDGLIITSATLSTEMADKCLEIGVPVVLFNRYVHGSPSSAICCDNEGAARQIADLFVRRGFSNIGYIAGVDNTSTNRDRESGFNARLGEAGLKVGSRAVGNYTYEGGYAAALKLAEGGDYPQAIFCANDIMAIGAMDAIRYQLTLSIPNDVSIIGFDDIAQAGWPVYNLTTMRPPVERMVQRAIANLVENQDSDQANQVTEVLAAQLVMRGTVKAE